MKRKNLLTAVAAMAMTAAMSMTVWAAGWQQNTTGWWWQNTDGTWPANTWQWLDGNNDGVSECYYFDGNGYMIAGTTTPDGYTVNSDGSWMIDGVIQQQNATGTQNVDSNIPSGYNANGISNVVIDMLNNTRAQNAAKYGETKALTMGEGIFVYYANGFRANYNSQDDNAIVYTVVEGIGMECSTLFKEATSATSAEAATQMLKGKGYDVISNGYSAIIDVDIYKILWYDFSGTPSIEVLKMDKYR